jgi:AmiR/NasT family two-component response regulator
VKKMAVPTKSSLAFSTTTLESKLRDLNSSMQSIQSVSQWIIQHRKHSKTIVGTWFKELRKASASRKLTLLYVANDVIQNSRRKAPEYKSEFIKALPKALHLIVK